MDKFELHYLEYNQQNAGCGKLLDKSPVSITNTFEKKNKEINTIRKIWTLTG